ncbi:MAG: PLDc N-terminal domain-containing protein [Candidatus Aenigmarchaeota archaeon]|nr:PLDc N-terminal domain-containing protein [Candidatus Aenigmarchaeota archaeon]
MIPLIAIWFCTSIFMLFLLTTIFWLWMLIDLLERKNFEDKVAWVLVMMFLCIVGSVMYYFLVYAKSKVIRKKAKKRKRKK